MKRLGIAVLSAVILVSIATLASRSQLLVGQSVEPRAGLPIDAISETVWIEEFDVAPDGATLAFKSAQAGTYDIWTVPAAGGTPTQLTSMPGREMKPLYSPDGQWIAFEADYGGVMIHDLYIVSAEGGEPIRLTHHPLHDANVMWSPDSRKIYFTTAMFWDNSLAEVDIETKEITQIASVGGGSWQLSPDGSTFVFTSNRKPDDDDQSNSDIYVMPVAGGDSHLLTPATFNARDTAPEWSPDGSKIAFISDRDGYYNLGVIDVATGQATMLLTEEIEHSLPRWSPDGQWITFTKNLDYQFHIFKIPAAGGGATQLTQLGGVNGGSSEAGQLRGTYMWGPRNEIFFYHSDPTRTGDIWTMSANGDDVRQITNHQHTSLQDPDLFVWPEVMEYTSFDGLEIKALVYKPKGSQAGDRLPALFFFRANSSGQHPMQWHPYIQYFTSRGYLVFAANYRGSTGRGKAYRQAVFTRGGEDDAHDAFIGMDILGSEGWVDPDRVGVFGGSTGGFLTNAAITKDPRRFKAAVCWYGDTDLVTMSSYSGLEGWNKFITGKTPLENPENYYNRSLAFHAASVKVPLLQLDAQGDEGGRFQQIEQYNVQAYIHGNWHEWVSYEKEPHGWYHFRPDSVEGSLTIMSQMFDKFLLGQDHDVKALAAEQREGIVMHRNPSIDLWNSLTYGRPEGQY